MRREHPLQKLPAQLHMILHRAGIQVPPDAGGYMVDRIGDCADEIDAVVRRLENIKRAAEATVARLYDLCPPGVPNLPSDGRDMGLTERLWCIARELENEIAWADEVHGVDGDEEGGVA